jgi:enhancing lycopene biosynthesis protein 2
VYDGSEIHESVLTLLSLDSAGATYQCIAPNIEQAHVVDHLTGQPAKDEKRNVLVEAARIARGEIADAATVKGSDFDAIFLPGGFGAAKNLCDFAFNGAECAVNSDIARILREAHSAGKPICSICIAPAVVAKVLGGEHPTLTIGTDAQTASALETMGASHCACSVTEIAIDTRNRLVSTPAYMLGTRISEVAKGIEKAVQTTLNLIREPTLA